MSLPSIFKTYPKQYWAPSHENFLAELISFYSAFRNSRLMWILYKSTSSFEYRKALSELFNLIKNFRIQNGFDSTIDINAITTLKGLPGDASELDKCKISLEAYHNKMCMLFCNETLEPDVVKNKSIYFTKFEKVCKKVLHQKDYGEVTFADAGLFFAYTLYQMMEKLGMELEEVREDNKTIDAGNFELKYKGSWIDCFNTLSGHHFIEDGDSGKRAFAQMFKKAQVSKKVNWIGTKSELARFVTLLHNDFQAEGIDHKAVCNSNEKKYEKAVNCFLFKEKNITPYDLINNQRSITKDRELLLLKAIAHLNKMQKTTFK